MIRPTDARLAKVVALFEELHGVVMGRVLPKLAGTMHGNELSFSQLTTIISVFIRGPMSIAEIANAADVTHTTASRMVDKLVKAGLMSRWEDPTDRRQKLVDLTPAGRAIPPEWRGFTIKEYVDILGSLLDATLRELSTIAAHVADHVPRLPEPFDAQAEQPQKIPGSRL